MKRQKNRITTSRAGFLAAIETRNHDHNKNKNKNKTCTTKEDVQALRRELGVKSRYQHALMGAEGGGSIANAQHKRTPMSAFRRKQGEDQSFRVSPQANPNDCMTTHDAPSSTWPFKTTHSIRSFQSTTPFQDRDSAKPEGWNTRGEGQGGEHRYRTIPKAVLRSEGK